MAVLVGLRGPDVSMCYDLSGSELSDPSKCWYPSRYNVATSSFILQLCFVEECRKTSQSTNTTSHALYDRVSPPAGHGNNACLQRTASPLNIDGSFGYYSMIYLSFSNPDLHDM